MVFLASSQPRSHWQGRRGKCGEKGGSVQRELFHLAVQSRIVKEANVRWQQIPLVAEGRDSCSTTYNILKVTPWNLKICRTQTTKGAGAGWLALKTIQDPKFGTDSQVLRHSQSISCSQISNSVEVCDSAGAPTFRPIFKSQCWQSPISSIFVAFSWPRHFLPTFKFQDVLEVILGC